MQEISPSTTACTAGGDAVEAAYDNAVAVTACLLDGTGCAERNIVCAAYDRIDVREGLENAIGYGNSLVAYAVGVLRGDNLAAAFFKCLLVTGYTSLRGGLAWIFARITTLPPLPIFSATYLPPS